MTLPRAIGLSLSVLKRDRCLSRSNVNKFPAEMMIFLARSDLYDIDRKIAIIKAEEDRLAAERISYEVGRAKSLAFIEMFERYTENQASDDQEYVAG